MQVAGVANLSGAGIFDQIRTSGVEFVISVPDITTAAGLLTRLEKSDTPRLVRVCKEDEGVGICAGLAHTGKRALLLIQQTGMLDSINAIRGVAVEYSLPVCMMVGLLEKEVGVRPRESKKFGVRIVEPILEAMGIDYHEIEQQADVTKIRPAIDAAYAGSKPTVILIGQRPK
jgi:sulfopyruvate decarboxylase subunit alpha